MKKLVIVLLLWNVLLTIRSFQMQKGINRIVNAVVESRAIATSSIQLATEAIHTAKHEHITPPMEKK